MTHAIGETAVSRAETDTTLSPASSIEVWMAKLPVEARPGFRLFVENLELDPSFEYLLNNDRRVQAVVEEVIAAEGRPIREAVVALKSVEIAEISERVYSDMPQADAAGRQRIADWVRGLLKPGRKSTPVK